MKKRLGDLQHMEIKMSDLLAKKSRRDVEDHLWKHVIKYVNSQEKQFKKAANLWVLYNLITYYISHQVEMRMRAAYQLETSRLFKL